MDKRIQKYPPPSSRFLLIFILGLYVATAHIFLPAFNRKEFYFLYQWSLFVNMPDKFIYALTWDEGKSFLLRDKTEELRSVVKPYILRYLLDRKDLERIRKDYKESLLKLCECLAIYFVELKGSLSDHFIHKKELEIVESIKL